MLIYKATLWSKDAADDPWSHTLTLEMTDDLRGHKLTPKLVLMTRHLAARDEINFPP